MDGLWMQVSRFVDIPSRYTVPDGMSLFTTVGTEWRRVESVRVGGLVTDHGPTREFGDESRILGLVQNDRDSRLEDARVAPVMELGIQ
jgi:hypothetical protein